MTNVEALNNKNVRAFLDTIAVSEGTTRYSYNTMFGNTRIADLSRHPRIYKAFTDKNGKVNRTSAAGRYQFLWPTWNGLQQKLNLPDFGPRSQDLAAIELLRQRGALNYVVAGQFAQAVYAARKEWASFPGAGYAQGERSLAMLQKAYTKALGNVSQAVNDVATNVKQTVKENPGKVGGGIVTALIAGFLVILILR